jgi:hypothetical protein
MLDSSIFRDQMTVGGSASELVSELLAEIQAQEAITRSRFDIPRSGKPAG